MFKKVCEKIGRLLRKKLYEQWRKAQTEYPRPILNDYENPNVKPQPSKIHRTTNQ